MTTQPSKSKSIPRAIALAILIAAFTAAVYILIVRAPGDAVEHSIDKGILTSAQKSWELVKKIGSDIKEAVNMQPQVTYEGTTVLEAKKPIAELSTIEKRFEHTYRWEHKWFGSTKQIVLKGQFVAKAGYDLTKPFSIDVSDNGQTFKATMPPAKVNSVELVKYEIVEDVNGYWNDVTKADREGAVNAMVNGAKSNLNEAKLLEEANQALIDQLEEIVKKSAPEGAIVTFQPAL